MSDAPPQLDPATVQSFVANAHGDLDVVRSLLAEEPASRERRLGLGWRRLGDRPRRGGAHGSPRQIALFLLENGARLDLFAAAMLGYFEVVSAVLSDLSGECATRTGPHGIPLVAARARRWRRRTSCPGAARSDRDHVG